MQIILSRILSPEEFGVIAVVNVFLVFFQMIADFGIGPAIIQNKDLDKKDINSIYSFSVYLALLLALIFAVMGKPISVFYNNSNYINIISVMSITLFFNALLAVPQNLLQKEKRFKFVNFFQIISNIIYGIVAISLGLLGFSYYSIVLAFTIKAIFLFIAYYNQNKIGFRLKFSLDSLKKIYAFSKNQFFFNFINYFSRNLDNLLIGRYIGESALGYYNKAYQISLYPNQILTNVISPVLQPILSNYQNEKEVIKKAYLIIVNILATIGIPLTVFFYFSSSEVILFMFGKQWGESIPVFKTLAMSIWIQMILSSTGGIFQAGNRTDLMVKSGLLSTALNVFAIFFGILMNSINHIALFLVISFSINFVQANYLLLVTMLNGTLYNLLFALKKPVLMGIAQLIVFIILPEFQYGIFINLIIKVIVFLFVFILSMILTKQYEVILSVFRSK